MRIIKEHKRVRLVDLEINSVTPIYQVQKRKWYSRKWRVVTLSGFDWFVLFENAVIVFEIITKTKYHEN